MFKFDDEKETSEVFKFGMLWCGEVWYVMVWYCTVL